MTNNPSGPTGSGRRPSGSVAQPPPTAAMNHLLLGKKPIVTSKPRRGPPPGSIPEPRIRAAANSKSGVSRTPNQPGASSLSEDGRHRTSSGSSSRSSIKATQWSRPQVGFKTNQQRPSIPLFSIPRNKGRKFRDGFCNICHKYVSNRTNHKYVHSQVR